ncbi:MAG: M23 family metallopeptidase [Bacteroidota bacterium]
MRSRKTLSSWLVTKYLLIIRNEENFAEKTTFSFNYAKVILFSLLLFVFLMLLSLFLVETLLSQWFDPRHAQLEADKKLIDLTEQVDVLRYEMTKKDTVINNLKRIISGDTLLTGQPTFVSGEREVRVVNNDVINTPSPIDSIFRQEFEESNVSFLTYSTSNFEDLQEVFLFSPITGYVSAAYDYRKGHLGVDIVTKKNEPVKCVADGTVIFASWTQDSGHVIAVQHRGNLISVYKHNAVLFEKVGNFVSAGEIISSVGNSGEFTDGPHLHFELWINGNSVNPEDFVSF